MASSSGWCRKTERNPITDVEASEASQGGHGGHDPVALEHKRRVGRDVVGDDDLQRTRYDRSDRDEEVAQLLGRTVPDVLGEEGMESGLLARRSEPLEDEAKVVRLRPGRADLPSYRAGERRLPSRSFLR
jgi:hypothetical protein